MPTTRRLALAIGVLLGAAFLLHVSNSAARERAQGPALGAESMPPAAQEPPSSEPLELDERRVARATVAEATEAASPIAPAVQTSLATVNVRVVDESGAGVKRARVVLAHSPAELDEARAAGVRSLTPIQGSTDAKGLVRLEVPSGRTLELSGCKYDATSNETVTVAALAPGAAADVRIEVRTRDDTEVNGRVIEADTGAPIAGARVYCRGSSGALFRSGGGGRAVRIPPHADPDAVTDADGRFRVATQSWIHTGAMVFAAGKSPRMASLRGAGSTSSVDDGPVVIELVQAARIEGTVRGAPPGAEVRAEMYGYELFDSSTPASMSVRLGGGGCYVSTVVTPAGALALEDVPAGVRAKLTVYDPAQREAVFTEPQPVATAAGVTHRVDWVIGGVGRFVVLVHEGDGRPAAGQEVWLLAPGPARPGLVESYWDPVARSRADAAGVAVFSDVDAGTWIVGLAPERGSADERAFAALGVAAEMPAAGGDVTLELTVQRGLYIAGQVLDPEGAPCAANVSARNGNYSVFLNMTAKQDGTFRVGPMPPGPFHLTAQVHRREGTPLAPSEEVLAHAGDEGVALRLRPGCELVPSAVDATTGAPAIAKFSLSQHGQEYGLRMTGGESSSATFGGLVPATYTLLAKSSDGRAGFSSGISLGAYERREIDVEVGLAGTVRVRYAGPAPYVDCRIEQDGVSLDVDTLQSGAESRFSLPPGHFTLLARAFDPTSSEVPRRKLFEVRRAIDVVAGVEQVIELSPE